MTSAKRVVVVAVDFSECGDDALHMGLSMVQRGQADRLHMVHVLDPRDIISSPEQPALWTEEQMLEQTPAVLMERAQAVAESSGLGFESEKMRPHARIGKAVPTLIQLCVDYEADMLIVGTHARRGMERLLLGSVSEALVREAPCPVMVARPKDYTSRKKTELPDRPYAPGEVHSYPSDVPFERTVSTELPSWHPSDTGPTGIRIV